jgi:hypothetical protein
LSTSTLDVALTLVEWAEYIRDDEYMVGGEAVSLLEDDCSCNEPQCWHLAAANIADARRSVLST